MKKISVIVPVYNVSEYLEKCLHTISNQTLKNIEIICVNDGSTDDSLCILKKYARDDKRIIIVDKRNEGAGAARNDGLAIAKGEYVIFLDADDFFDLHLLEYLAMAADGNKADICACTAWSVNKSLKLAPLNYDLDFFTRMDNKSFSPMELGNNTFDVLGIEPWNKIYRRDFLNKIGIKFQNLKRSNDVFFTSACLVRAERVTVINRELVYYRIHNRVKKGDVFNLQFLNFYDALRNLHSYLIKNNDIEYFLESYIKLATTVIFYNIYFIDNKDIKNTVRRYIYAEGIKELGINLGFIRNKLGFLPYLEYFCLKYENLGICQDVLYLLCKINNYYSKQGIYGVLKKIICG